MAAEFIIIVITRYPVISFMQMNGNRIFINRSRKTFIPVLLLPDAGSGNTASGPGTVIYRKITILKRSLLLIKYTDYLVGPTCEKSKGHIH
jgi:hypothetical protein